jgi:hypothetical protein
MPLGPALVPALGHEAGRWHGALREPDGREREKVTLGPAQLALAFETREATRHRLEQDGHVPPAIGDLDRLAGSHPSKDGARIAP